MEVKEEDDGAVVECVFKVLPGARTISSNPDPDPNPQLVITRLTLEGKGANGTVIKGYPRPGSKGVSKNAVAFTFQMETVGPEYEKAMHPALTVMASQMAKVWKSEDIMIKLVRMARQRQQLPRHTVHDHCLCDRSVTVAPNRVTSDEINDAVVAAGFAEPISICTRTMKHPSKAASLCAFFFNMGGQE